MQPESLKIGKRGTVVIPARFRRRLGFEEGVVVIVEERDEGLLLRPTAVAPIEIYSPKRRAEFLLSNALDSKDYARAVREVRRLGLDPEQIPHVKPRKPRRA